MAIPSIHKPGERAIAPVTLQPVTKTIEDLSKEEDAKLRGEEPKVSITKDMPIKKEELVKEKERIVTIPSDFVGPVSPKITQPKIDLSQLRIVPEKVITEEPIVKEKLLAPPPGKIESIGTQLTVAPSPNPIFQPLEYAKWVHELQAKTSTLKLALDIKKHNQDVENQGIAIDEFSKTQQDFDKKWSRLIKPSIRTKSGIEFTGTSNQFAEYSREAQNLNITAKKIGESANKINKNSIDLDKDQSNIEKTYFHKLDTGDLVPKFDYKLMPVEEKVQLNKLGVEGYRIEKEQLLKRDYHKLDTGEYVPLVDYTFWPTKMKELANTKGLESVSFEGLEGQGKVDKMKDLGIIDTTIQRPIYLGEDKEGNIRYNEAPWKNNPEKVKLWNNEKDLLSDKTPWFAIKKAISFSGVETPEGIIEPGTPLKAEPGFLARNRQEWRPEWFNQWYKKLPGNQKLMILGNHSNAKERSLAVADTFVSMVPIAGTIKDWNRMSNTWRGISIIADLTTIAPILRVASNAVKNTIKLVKGAPLVTPALVIENEAKLLAKMEQSFIKAGYTSKNVAKAMELPKRQLEVFKLLDKADAVKSNIKIVDEALETVKGKPNLEKIHLRSKRNLESQLARIEDNLSTSKNELTRAGWDRAKWLDEVGRQEVYMDKFERGLLATYREIDDLERSLFKLELRRPKKWGTEAWKTYEKTGKIDRLKLKKLRQNITTIEKELNVTQLRKVKDYHQGKYAGTGVEWESGLNKEQLQHYSREISDHTDRLYKEIKSGIGQKLSKIEHEKLVTKIKKLEDELEILTINPPKTKIKDLALNKLKLRDEITELRAKLFSSDTMGNIEKRMVELGKKEIKGEPAWMAARGEEYKDIYKSLQEIENEIVQVRAGLLPGGQPRLINLGTKAAKLEEKLTKLDKELVEDIYSYMDVSMHKISPAAGGNGGSLIPDKSSFAKSPPGSKHPSSGGGSSLGTITREQKAGIKLTRESMPSSPISPQTAHLLDQMDKIAKARIKFEGAIPGTVFRIGTGGLQALTTTPIGLPKTYDRAELEQFLTMSPAKIADLSPSDIATAQSMEIIRDHLGKPIDQANKSDIEKINKLMTDYYAALNQGLKNMYATYDKTNNISKAITEGVTAYKEQTRTSPKVKLRVDIAPKLRMILKSRIKAKIKPRIIPPTEEIREEERKRKGKFIGGVAFQTGRLKAGRVWHILVYPYGEKDYEIYVGDNPPHGVFVVDGIEKAAETVQQLYGITPKTSIDIGIMDVNIGPGPGRKPKIKFSADPKQKTRQKLSAKRAKVHVEGKGESTIKRIR